MKKVNIYKVFTNKMIQLNENKIYIFYAKNNFLLILKSVWNKGATSF